MLATLLTEFSVTTAKPTTPGQDEQYFSELSSSGSRQGIKGPSAKRPCNQATSLQTSTKDQCINELTLSPYHSTPVPAPSASAAKNSAAPASSGSSSVPALHPKPLPSFPKDPLNHASISRSRTTIEGTRPAAQQLRHPQLLLFLQLPHCQLVREPRLPVELCSAFPAFHLYYRLRRLYQFLTRA